MVLFICPESNPFGLVEVFQSGDSSADWNRIFVGSGKTLYQGYGDRIAMNGSGNLLAVASRGIPGAEVDTAWPSGSRLDVYDISSLVD